MGQRFNFNVKRVFCGRYMTALDMKGFSVTLLKVNDQILQALDFSVDPIAWIPGNKVDFKTLINGGIKIEEKDDVNIDNDVLLSSEGSNILRTMLERACSAIASNKEKLNKLDQICGDGDCGSTLEFGQKLLLNKMKKFKFESLYVTMRDVGECLAEMGGSSGALYGYLFVSFSKWIKIECKDGNVNGLNVSNALLNAVQDLSVYSGAKQGNRTMIDALYPAVKALNDYYQGNDDDDMNT